MGEEIDEETKASIKAIFADADVNGDGFIAKDELKTVFDTIGAWSDEEFDELYAAADTSGDGKMSYNEFLDWVLSQDQEEGEIGDVMDELLFKDESDFGSWEDEDPELEGLDVDLDQELTKDEWITTLGEMGLDKGEAVSMFDEYAEESGEEVVPLWFYIDTLPDGVQDDAEAIEAIVAAAAKAKEKVAAGEVPNVEEEEEEEEPPPAAEGEEGEQEVVPEAPPCKPSLAATLDRVFCQLVKDEKSAEEAWGLIQEGVIPLSKRQKASLEKFNEDQAPFVKKLQAAMKTPPKLNASAGQRAAVELCTEAVDAIVAKCKEEGTKFTDAGWDDKNVALYVDKEKPGYDCTVEAPTDWKRLSEILPEAKLFTGEAKPTDIIQGGMGTCFLLGAMGSFAADAKKIKHMFVKADFEVGVFGVRFCVDGEWTYVIIDDVMPVAGSEEEGYRLIYATGKDPNEVWVPLLEKAYCKLHTCYEMCDGGNMNEAVHHFGGGIGGTFSTKKFQDDPAKYFKKLQTARKKGWLLTTAFQLQEGAKTEGGSGKCGEAMLPCGLVGGHAYSMLKVAESEENQLVCCRNPWGSGEWTGKWDDQDAESWTDAMKEACGYTEADDGTFWMCVQDYMANSDGADYARIFGPNWNKVTIYSKFQTTGLVAKAVQEHAAEADDEISFAVGDEIPVQSFADFWWEGTDKEGKTGFFPGEKASLIARPVAKYELEGTPDGEKPVKAVIILTQSNVLLQRKFYKRKEDGLNYKDTSYNLMRIEVFDAEGKKLFSKQADDRTVWNELALPPGACSIFVTSPGGKGGDFSVRVFFKNGAARLTSIEGAQIEDLMAAQKKAAELKAGGAAEEG